MNLQEAERLARLNAKDREAHVYLVDAEKVYFKVYRDAKLIRCKFSCVYLGIGLEPSYLAKINYPVKGKSRKNYFDIKIKIKSSYFKKGMICCYCEIELNESNCTREHIIPKHKGGKIVMPACKPCNNEKGGLMLISYIQILEDKPHIAYRDKLKIKNGYKILETLNK